MIHVAILPFNSTELSLLALPMDILNATSVLWAHLFQGEIKPRFSVHVVTENGKPVQFHHSISVTPHCSLSQAKEMDLLIITSGHDPMDSFADHQPTIHEITKAYNAGVHIAAVCSGVFLLAETGLLDNRKATTHWGLAPQFKDRYPRVLLEPEEKLTEQDNLICSCGADAGINLSLHLIGKYFGAQAATRCEQALSLDPVHQKRGHGNERIAKAQSWIEAHCHKELHVKAMAEMLAMSRRTFERQFKAATGDSPGKYLQQVRIEKAKRLLESEDDSFEHITLQVGYEDPSTFRKIFQRNTGLAPSTYRSRFK